MGHRFVRACREYGVLVLTAAGALLLYRWLGWKWPPAVILALLTGAAVFIAWLYARNGVRAWLDARRGLATREWAAIRALGNCTERPDQGLFDSFSLSLTRRTDDDVLVGYATILTHLMIEARVGPDPSDRLLEQLAADGVRRWRSVIRQQPARFAMLLRIARDYERDGFPHADWDNFRAMAAAAGALRSRGVGPSRRRFEVAARYEEFVDGRTGTPLAR